MEQGLVHEDSDELIFLRVNGNSFEVKSGDDYSSVKGRLRGALAFWNDIHAPQFILDVIDYGYKLPLLQIPPPFTAKNNSSALEQAAFVESAINDLFINGCVTEVFEAPVIINPLSVSVQKSGKKRLILDLRHVNQFLYKCRFRCEDLSIETKCVWEPTQVITWLGAVLNTSTSEISATAKRITSLQEDLATLLAIPSSCHPVRKLASVCGKIISLGPCVGNVSRLMSRNLFAVINTAPTWNSYVRLSSEALAELVFWKSNAASLNGIPIWSVRHKPSKIVYSDASGSACGGFIEFEGKMFHQNWSDFEKAQSSTFRELLAVSLSVKAFVESLRAQTVTWFTDNQNVVRIVNSGSKTPALQELAMDIHRSCLLSAINIDMQWIPRDLNSAADDISNFIDYDDYTINDTVFSALDDLWGPHTCDRFACSYNAKVQCFNSRFYQPGSSGVNAFSQDWSHHNNWLCPPVYLTCKVIKHMELCCAQGTLIVPLWKSAHFWPILCSDGFHWSTFIHDWVILPNFPNLFIRGKAKNSIFGSKPLAFVSLALHLDFSIIPRLDSELSRKSFLVPCV